MTRKTPMWRRYLTFWGRNIERDVRDELEFHLDARARELIDQGWDPVAARTEARRRFGATAPIAAACHQIDRHFERERRVTRYLADVVEDMRFAWRQFVRQPRYFALIALTLVVGIAASTTFFAVVDGTLLKPLPYPEPDRLVRLTTWNLRGEYVNFRERTRTMEVAAYYPAPREVTLEIAGRPARLSAAGVTADLFRVLRIEPTLGRTFTFDEMRPNSPGILGGTHWRTFGVVIVSSGVWQEYFGSSPRVIGQTLLIEGVPHTIVGVMPPGFHFPRRDIALWFPHNIDPATLWAGNVATMIGRLREGRTLADARAEVRAVLPTFRELMPFAQYVPYYGRDANVDSLSESIVAGSRRVLLVLLAAIGVVLLVLCVNVANLLLARGIAREREMMTRAALGAGRTRLARQVIVENLTIAFGSGVLGIFLAMASLRIVTRLLPPDLPRVEQVALDARVLLFALGVSLATGLAFGLMPAIRATRAGGRLLARAAGVVTDRRERRVSSVLAALEFSFAVVLAASAVLLLQSLWNLTSIDPGFRTERLVTASVSPPGFAEREPTSRVLFAQRLLENLRAVPGVESVALATGLPFDAGLFGTVFQIEGRLGPGQRFGTANATYQGVTQDFFVTMGTPVIEGRGFLASDDFRSTRVALISRRIAREFWGDHSPIGARIRFTDNRQYMIGPDGQLPWFTIVGVVGDVHFATLTDDAAMVYLPLSQKWDVQSLRVVVRTSSEASSLGGTLQGVVSQLDAATPVTDVRAYATRLGETIARPRFAAYLLGTFAVIAVFLAAVGAYGVLSHALSRRVREIGVRLAFGASGRDVFALLFGHGMRVTLCGLLLGVPAAIASTRVLSSLLFGVNPSNPAVFAGVAIVLLLVGFFVSYLPARRARSMDPIAALRYE